jgi:O-antigen/teichoic acid export membrane protein
MIEHKREIQDVFLLTALQGMNYLAPLIVFPYLMVVLGAEKFGYIGFSLSIIQYLMLLVDFGFNFSATKRIAQSKNNRNELNEIFWSTLYAKLSLLLLSFILLIVIAFGFSRFQMYSKTMIIMFIMVVGNTFSFVWMFQGMGQIRIISIINIVSKLTILPLTFFLVRGQSDYLKAATILSFVYLFSGLIATIFLINKRYITQKVKADRTKIINEIKYAFPIFLSTAVASIYTALFVIILGYFSNPTEVGKYTAVEKIVRGFCFLILIPVTQAFYPKISSMSPGVKSFRIIKNSLLIVSVIMFGAFVILFFFSKFIVSLLGSEYEGAELLFKIMSFLPLVIAAGGILGQLGLLAAGNEKDKKNYQMVYIIAATVSVIAVFSLVPHFFSTGAAIALLITEFIVFLGMLWFNRKNLLNK